MNRFTTADTSGEVVVAAAPELEDADAVGAGLLESVRPKRRAGRGGKCTGALSGEGEREETGARWCVLRRLLTKVGAAVVDMLERWWRGSPVGGVDRGARGLAGG